MTTAPLELRIRTAMVLYPFIAFFWLSSWIRFAWLVLDLGSAVATVDRQLWLHAMTVAMLDEMDRAAQQGVYTVRVVRAALAPYYPKEKSHP